MADDKKAILVQPVPVTSPNQTQVSCGYVGPNAVSRTQIGNGRYSLAKRSNVPFVELVGAGGFSKVISWGETAEVASKTLVSVKNVSYHGGNIWLNRGNDPDNQPRAITVPVTCSLATFTGYATQFLITAFPCDTRAAHRAYFTLDARRTAGGATSLQVRLRQLSATMNTPNTLGAFAAPYGPGTGMLVQYTVTGGTAVIQVPLGFGATWGDDSRPHTLLDASDVFIRTTVSFAADFTWPIYTPIAPGVLPIPGAWYTVEY